MYELYALIDPKDSKIRYIGYTSDPKLRFRSHISSSLKSRNKISHKSNWIRDLKQDNLEPIYKTLIRSKNLENIKQLEIDHIKYYNQFYKLTNNTKGGDGVNGLKWSKENKAKIKGRIIPGGRNIPAKIEILNLKSGEYRILNNKTEVAEYIKCSPSTVRGHHNRLVNGWYINYCKR